MSLDFRDKKYTLPHLTDCEKSDLSDISIKMLDSFYFSKPLPDIEKKNSWNVSRHQEDIPYEEKKANRLNDIRRGVSVMKRLEDLMADSRDAAIIEEAVLLLWELARLECHFCETEGEPCGICYEYLTSEPVLRLAEQNCENALCESKDS